MSRSIHATHAQIHRERQFDYAREEARRDKLAPLDAQLHRKRFVKAMSRQSRMSHSIDRGRNCTSTAFTRFEPC